MQTATSSSYTSPSGYKTRSSNWTSLRLLNVYRLGLSAIFFSQSFVIRSPLLDIVNHRLYSWVSLAFLVLSLVWMLAARIERRGYQKQLSLQVYSDTILILLLMHACGGISSGLGMLLIISIAVIGLLGEQALAIIFASLATLGLLAEFVYSNIYIANYSGTSTQVGLIGVALFATAIVTNKLTLRIRSSEQLVQQRERDVALLSALNQEIIENLQAGVIVLARNDRVRHINNTALNMLDIAASNTFSLQRDQPRLLAALESWRESSQRDTPFLPSETGIDNLQVSFRQLRGQAHEIRNPLGAISYAAQLLTENSELAESDQRMTEIIHQHSDRINHIIEDILQISRGELNVMGEINLQEWLPKFIDDFCLSDHATADRFEINTDQSPMDKATIRFDPGHLNQIMTNLCNNALIHGKNGNLIHIKVYRMQSHSLTIEIADEGPGIRLEDMDKIFEPFYTTNHKGSGLGLYIVNQLCDLNNASISVKQNNNGGTSFIIRCQLVLTDLVSRPSAA